MDDFERLEGRGILGAVRRDFRSALEALGLLERAFEPPPGAGRFRGRGTVFSLAVPGREPLRAVVRFYRHGGLSGLLFNGWFAGPSRAARELEIARAALEAGVPSVRPLAALTFRTLGLFYRARIVTEEIAEARDLAELARAAATDPDGPARMRRAARAAAAAVRAMHDRGFRHADLNLKNIVADPAGETARAWILDWDLATRSGRPLSRRARMGNLMRLDRSARKFDARGLAVPLKERLRFLKHYFRAGGVAAPTGPELRRWALLARIHSVTWWLF